MLWEAQYGPRGGPSEPRRGCPVRSPGGPGEPRQGCPVRSTRGPWRTTPGSPRTVHKGALANRARVAPYSPHRAAPRGGRGPRGAGHWACPALKGRGRGKGTGRGQSLPPPRPTQGPPRPRRSGPRCRDHTTPHWGDARGHLVALWVLCRGFRPPPVVPLSDTPRGQRGDDAGGGSRLGAPRRAGVGTHRDTHNPSRHARDRATDRRAAGPGGDDAGGGSSPGSNDAPG